MSQRRNERVSMCQKLKEIHGFRPQFILDTYCKSSDIPINMNEILKKMNISCLPSDFYELEANLQMKHKSIMGMVASKGDALNILYSKHLNDATVNYILAHELGHCCLHLPATSEFHVELKTENDIYSYPTWFKLALDINSKKNSVRKEQEADTFAAHLLLPDRTYESYITHNPHLSCKQLSKIFGVPLKLVGIKNKNHFLQANEGGAIE